MCFACGADNPAGLHLKFSPYGDAGLQSEFTPGKIYQGYKDVVHGGFIGLLLDEVMVNLPWKRLQQPVVSAEIRIRLHRPAPVDKSLVLTAVFDGDPNRQIIAVKGEARLQDGTLIATAWAKCMKVKTGT